jgi:hypothetical protein
MATGARNNATAPAAIATGLPPVITAATIDSTEKVAMIQIGSARFEKDKKKAEAGGQPHSPDPPVRKRVNTPISVNWDPSFFPTSL